MDITRYGIKALNSEGPITSPQICVGKELNSLQEELSLKRKRLTISEKFKKEIAHRALKYEYPKLATGAEKKKNSKDNFK